MTIKIKVNGKWTEVSGGAGSGTTAEWGHIGGTLGNQADLKTALDDKADNSNVIHLDGEEDVTDVKNFLGGLTVADLSPAQETSQMAMPAKQISARFSETDDEIQAIQEGLANKLGKTENAVSATKATQDSQGRSIVDTYALKTDLTSVYKVQGSCTTAQLASKAKNKGDVWNLTDAGSYGPAGTNVVWNGTEWDALGGTYDLSGYLPKSGGTMTGNLTIGEASIGTNGYIEGTWLKTTSAGKLITASDKIVVLDAQGWLYYNDKAQLKESLGVNAKADSSALSGYVPTSRKVAGKALTGDVSLGPSDVGALAVGGKAVSAGTADSATKATNDGSNRNIVNTYATKAELPNVDGKLDKSGGAMTGYLSDKNASQVRNLRYSATEPTSSDGNVGDVWVTPSEGEDLVDQNTTGIKVGGIALQDASTSQDGLMTKEQVTALNGKLGKSENAVSATKATQDGNGKIISETYAPIVTVNSIGVTNEIGGTPDAPTLKTTVNGKSSTVNLPAGGQSKKVTSYTYSQFDQMKSDAFQLTSGDMITAYLITNDSREKLFNTVLNLIGNDRGTLKFSGSGQFLAGSISYPVAFVTIDPSHTLKVTTLQNGKPIEYTMTALGGFGANIVKF